MKVYWSMYSSSFLIYFNVKYSPRNITGSFISIFFVLILFCNIDGRPQWEVEAKIIREKSQGVSNNSFTLTLTPQDYYYFFDVCTWINEKCEIFFLQSCIVVEVPPYHSKTVGSAVQVQFYVCNGKRKRSQSQRFTYLSGEIKGSCDFKEPF